MSWISPCRGKWYWVRLSNKDSRTRKRVRQELNREIKDEQRCKVGVLSSAKSSGEASKLDQPSLLHLGIKRSQVCLPEPIQCRCVIWSWSVLGWKDEGKGRQQKLFLNDLVFCKIASIFFYTFTLLASFHVWMYSILYSVIPKYAALIISCYWIISC